MNKKFHIAIAVLGIMTASVSYAAPQDYRFELVGTPTAEGGKNILQIRIIHLPDRKPVAGAVVFEVTADMGPEGMPTMTSPAKLLADTAPGIYRIEIRPDMAGNWGISLAAKVQGEAETVRGSITAKLAK